MSVLVLSTTMLSSRSSLMQKLLKKSICIGGPCKYICYHGVSRRHWCASRFPAPACCAKYMHSVSSRSCEGVGETTSLVSLFQYKPPSPSNERADSNCIQQHSGTTSWAEPSEEGRRLLDSSPSRNTSIKQCNNMVLLNFDKRSQLYLTRLLSLFAM